jgi:hypothetical protein
MEEVSSEDAETMRALATAAEAVTANLRRINQTMEL